MSTQISYGYKISVSGGVTPTPIANTMQAVPVDNQTLQFWGLRVTADGHAIVGTIITRTIVVAMGPSVAARVTPNVDQSTAPGGAILSFTMVANGLDYIRPPVVSIADPTGAGASAYATLGVYGVNPTAGGSGYTAGTTTVTATGGELAPGGTQAVFGAVTVVGTAITAVAITSPGGPYNSPPTLTAVDTGGGTGAVLVAQLGVSGLVLQNGGQNYTGPTVTFTPWFKSVCPDAYPAAQIASVQGWMQVIIENGTNAACAAQLGVVS